MANVIQNSDSPKDFAAQKINVRLKGKIKALSFWEIDKILEQKIKSKNKTFVILSKNTVVVKSTSIEVLAQNFAYYLKQAYYFDKNTVFEISIELGQLKITNPN